MGDVMDLTVLHTLPFLIIKGRHTEGKRRHQRGLSLTLIDY